MSADPMFHHMPSELDPWLPSASPAEISQLAVESLRWQAQEIFNEVLCGDEPGEQLPEQDSAAGWSGTLVGRSVRFWNS